MQNGNNENIGWADNPVIRQRIRNVLYAVCGLLVVADFIVHRHVYMPLEKFQRSMRCMDLQHWWVW